MQAPMKILGIESSCDDTAAAVVTGEREILSSVVWSQLKEHQAYGGVVPEIAARAHLQAMEPVLEAALQQADCKLWDIDLIAATAGPGLIGGVMVGAMTAKALALVSQKPFIAVNHLEGHALTVRLTHHIAFPYLMLLISGGHCQWLAVEGVGRYRLLGATLDDALGEAFDKVAKMLGLSYPGGPQVEKLAAAAQNPSRFDFPRPLAGKEGCDFSFSGLKTAVRQSVEALLIKNGELSMEDKQDVCAAFQQAATECLLDRLKHAMGIYEQDFSQKQLVVAGGVAANQMIRRELQKIAEQGGYQLICPPPSLCTDNAAMIAWAGYERFQQKGASDYDFEPKARWSLTELS